MADANHPPVTDDFASDAARPKGAVPPSIRLAFGALLWRVGMVTFLVLEYILWRRLKPFAPRKSSRLAWLAYYTPQALFMAFLFAAVVTVLADIAVRLLLRPIIRRWLSPREAASADGTHLPFLLVGSDETILHELPARRFEVGRRWTAGTLVRTSRRLWFFPSSAGWTAPEPWSIPLERLRLIRVSPPGRGRPWLIAGMPDRIAFGDDSGEERSFALADPLAVLDWFDDLAVTRHLHMPS